MVGKDGLIPIALLGIGGITVLGIGLGSKVSNFVNGFRGEKIEQQTDIPKTDPAVPDSTIPNVIDTPEPTNKNEKDNFRVIGLPDYVPPTATTPNPKPDVVDTVTRPEPKSNEQKVEEIKTEKSKVIQVSKGIKTNPKTVFTGHGSTFEGGSITEIDIGRRSTGQIAKEYGVTASQAANIRAQTGSQNIAIRNKGESDEVFNARKESDRLLQIKIAKTDFGTNTGSGIGSVTSANSKIGNKLPSKGAVSNSDFAGLSPEQIALRLTGGNINNFA